MAGIESSATIPTASGRPGPTRATFDSEDAGTDDDDAGTDPTSPPQAVADADDELKPRQATATGFCERKCSRELCSKPDVMVCSSEQGYCILGCDKEWDHCSCAQVDFACAEDQPLFCDYPKRRCVALDTDCTTDFDCPSFDERLKHRGSLHCEAGRCRYTANDPDLQASRHVGIAQSAETLSVQRPASGERIHPDDLSGFTFQFEVPAQVVVASILTREIKNLDDGAKAAIWAAYLEAGQALDGVTVEEGGAMHEGVWSPSAPDWPMDAQLYLYVLAYDQGQLVAQSELVPFTIGLPRPTPGSTCDHEGDFCGETALLCAAGSCRVPCASDDDCEVGSCDRPGRYGVLPRLCSL